jgi:tRNA-dihydrouridine synthase 3
LKRIEPHKEFYHDKNLAQETAAAPVDEEEAFNDLEAGAQPVVTSDIPGESEAEDVPLRPEEKRRLNWDNGIYLAPLTTVGNLVCLFQRTSEKERI